MRQSHSTPRKSRSSTSGEEYDTMGGSAAKDKAQTDKAQTAFRIGVNRTVLSASRLASKP